MAGIGLRKGAVDGVAHQMRAVIGGNDARDGVVSHPLSLLLAASKSLDLRTLSGNG